MYKLIKLIHYVKHNRYIVDEVKQLASLPSLDELRGKLVGLIKSPSQKLASVAVAPANKLVNVLHAKANQ